jgi:hypothetical protein
MDFHTLLSFAHMFKKLDTFEYHNAESAVSMWNMSICYRQNISHSVKAYPSVLSFIIILYVKDLSLFFYEYLTLLRCISGIILML